MIKAQRVNANTSYYLFKWDRRYLASGKWNVDDNLNNLHSNLQDKIIANILRILLYIADFFCREETLQFLIHQY